MGLRHYAVITLILLVGVFLRGRGLAWGLPYILDGDEFRVVYNGLSVYYTGEQRNTADSAMQTYPPLRSWEIALTRALHGDALPIGQQVWWGRWLSFSYSLWIGALFFALGKRLSGDVWAGYVAALFWATWEVRETRLVLADMPALCFFLLALYAGLRGWLRSAWLAGLGAGLAKYNMFPILIFPLLLSLRHPPKYLMEAVFFPLVLVLMPIGALFFRTVNLEGVKYDYFDPEAAAHYVEQVQFSLSENDYQQYLSHAAGWDGRLRMNWDLIRASLNGGILILAGMSLLRQRPHLWMLFGIASLQFILISRFRALGARQLLGIMAILILLASLALNRLMRWRREFGLVLCLIAGFQAQQAYQQGDFLRQTPLEVEIVAWLLANAPTGSLIITQIELYELDELHGFSGEKSFQALHRSVWEDGWACLGADYVIWNEAKGRVLAEFQDQLLIMALPACTQTNEVWIQDVLAE